MDISFETRAETIFMELCHQVKRAQECAESVVPDINDDIGRIASVQTAVFLKSKDITGRGVTIVGEASAALLYITENETSVSYVSLSKQFVMEYDVADVEADVIAHINLSVSNCEARVINPRKVSVTFELCGELSCYKREQIMVETLLPPDTESSLHAKYEHTEAVFANSASEKTFTVNEQYVFPGGKPTPSRLVSQSADFVIGDAQLIGSKIVLKGNVYVSVCYLSNEVNYPVRVDFSSPFSQIVDIGTDNMVSCTAIIAMTSAYYDLAEAINGDKTLESELHAVVQVVSRFKQSIVYVSDAYSNLMPTRCHSHGSVLGMLSEPKRLKLVADERISVVEDCMDVLSVFSSVSQVPAQQGKLSAAVTLDIVYRTNSGNLSAVRRLVSLESEYNSAVSRLITLRLADNYLRPDGAYIDAHITLEALYQSCTNIELVTVDSVSMDEDTPYIFEKFPTISLVRAEDESLWELAKLYHSSEERIRALNDVEDGAAGKLLLVPKAQ